MGRCSLFQLINWQWFSYNWQQKARKLPVGVQWGIHIFLLSHGNQLERRIYKRLKLPATISVFHSRLGDLLIPVIYTWNSGADKMSFKMFSPYMKKITQIGHYYVWKAVRPSRNNEIWCKVSWAFSLCQWCFAFQFYPQQKQQPPD